VSNDLSCSLRSVATSLLGDACWSEGNLVEARQAYAQAVLISQGAGNIHMSSSPNSNLADILVEEGKLHQAARRVLRDLADGHITGRGKFSPLAENVYAGLSRISYEWNHLEDAEKYVSNASSFLSAGERRFSCRGRCIVSKVKALTVQS